MNYQNTINLDGQTVVRCQTLRPSEAVYAYQKIRESTPLSQTLTQRKKEPPSQIHHRVLTNLLKKKMCEEA